MCAAEALRLSLPRCLRLNFWSQCVRGVGLGLYYKPISTEIIQVLELSISDINKP